MDSIWANRLIAGTKTWDQVPGSRKNGVKDILQQRVNDGTISQEKYDSIVVEDTIIDVTDW